MTDAERWHDALREIAEYWGQPMPLGTSYKALTRKWLEDCRHLRNIARRALEPADDMPTYAEMAEANREADEALAEHPAGDPP